MRTTPLLTAAAVLALSACDVLSSTWLEVQAGRGTTTRTIEWPPGSGEAVRVRDHLSDPAGLAGLEVEVRVPGEPPVMLTASDFGANATFGPLDVPGAGMASVFVTIRQSGDVVAEGHVTWRLERRVEWWHVRIDRSPQPPPETVRDDESPHGFECVVPWCRQLARIEIDEAARNYSDEALWLTVWDGYTP